MADSSWACEAICLDRFERVHINPPESAGREMQFSCSVVGLCHLRFRESVPNCTKTEVSRLWHYSLALSRHFSLGMGIAIGEFRLGKQLVVKNYIEERAVNL